MDGKAYLAGPYKGAPLSLVVVVPAVSGPYDLGNVAVRAAIYVNPVTAQVTTISDPLPQILDGIQLRGKSLRVNIDRPNFALNPTNCRPAVRRRDDLRRSGHGRQPHELLPGGELRGDALQAEADSEPLRRRQAAWPSGDQGGPADQAGRSQPAPAPRSRCQRASFSTTATSGRSARGRSSRPNQCPDGSLLGTAEAVTPILDQPLRGNVYLRSSNHNLPDLVADLEGQIDIELAGKIDTVKGGSLRTTFASVPDAPVTEFTLQSGRRQTGPSAEQRKPLRQAANTRDQDGRPEQRQAEDQDQAERPLRLERRATSGTADEPVSFDRGRRARQWGPRGESQR